MTLLSLSPTRPAPTLSALPVAIIGAGPVGLATAAELVERGIDCVVLESGGVADNVRAWGHVRLFSPWSEVIAPAGRRLLEATGWHEPLPSSHAPTGAELAEHYLDPLAATEPIRERLQLGTRVLAVSREGMDRTRSVGRAQAPLVVRVEDAHGIRDIAVRAVIDASGTYGTHNPLGSNGLDPVGLSEVTDHVWTALPDVLGAARGSFEGSHVTVVGAGHSAANTLLDLVTLHEESPATRVTWVIRTPSATRLVTGETDELPGRASLGARVQAAVQSGSITLVDRFELLHLRRSEGRIVVTGRRGDGVESFETNIIVGATGFRPDLGMLREIRLDLDEVVEAPRRLAPLIDPNVHSCGTVEPHGFAELQHPEPGFFIAGMKSYGRAPTFLLATGYEQVRSIAAWLDGDLTAASEVRLTLPATGVCSTDRSAVCC